MNVLIVCLSLVVIVVGCSSEGDKQHIDSVDHTPNVELPIQRLVNDSTQKPSDFVGFDDPVPQSIKPMTDIVQVPNPRFSNHIFFDFNNNDNQLLIDTRDLSLRILFSNDVDRAEVRHDASDFFVVEDDMLSTQSISIALQDLPLVPGSNRLLIRGYAHDTIYQRVLHIVLLSGMDRIVSPTKTMLTSERYQIDLHDFWGTMQRTGFNGEYYRLYRVVSGQRLDYEMSITFSDSTLFTIPLQFPSSSTIIDLETVDHLTVMRYQGDHDGDGEEYIFNHRTSQYFSSTQLVRDHLGSAPYPHLTVTLTGSNILVSEYIYCCSVAKTNSVYYNYIFSDRGRWLKTY